MKRIIILLLINFVLFTEMAHANICLPYPLDGGFENSSQVIDFPDGRSVTVASHTHEARQIFNGKIPDAVGHGSIHNMSGEQI